MKDIKFRIITYNTPEYWDALKLREEMLRKPRGEVFTPEELEKEKGCIHIIGEKGDEIVSALILLPDGTECKMQRVAVKEAFQYCGVGRQMISFCENHARNQGFTSIYCHTRPTTVDFYLKQSYLIEDAIFDEEGNTIAHFRMRKTLLS